MRKPTRPEPVTETVSGGLSALIESGGPKSNTKSVSDADMKTNIQPSPTNTPPVPTNTPCGDKIDPPSQHIKFSTGCGAKSTEWLNVVDITAKGYKYHKKTESLVQNSYEPYTFSVNINPTPCRMTCQSNIRECRISGSVSIM